VTKLIQVICWFLIALPGVADTRIEKISLGNGLELTIQENPYNRELPYSYYDQTMESITQLYPEHEVLVGRRLGTLGKTIYSLLCYKQSNKSGTVEVGGMFVVGKASWHFSSEVPVGLFTNSLVLILEAISKSPSNTAMGPDD